MTFGMLSIGCRRREDGLSESIRVWRPPCELLGRTLQQLQIGVEVLPRLRQRLVGHPAEPSQCLHAPVNRSRASAKYWISGGNSVSTRSSVLLRAAMMFSSSLVESIARVRSSALLVELIGERVQLAQEVADLFGIAGQDVVDLGLHHFQVRDAAAVQHGGDAGQRAFGGRERRRVLQRDGRPLRAAPTTGSPAGGANSTCWVPNRGLADLRGRVGGQLDTGLGSR